ncbi:FadR/GntR family transcriptional regulator [Rathayibacter soli]|uniref:FadR/GntR family transcriptional regulator n=1 Tax=Rathayibacter soli TaxID=3144168 RepID=UPI0027E3C8D2|nr:FadR/GntR family transcriptional regulator [Glaciibacter superstes]
MTRPSRLSVVDEMLPVLRDRARALEVGQQMPTELQIIEEFGVSRQTAREVLAVLKTEGYIEIRHGRGAFVADKSIADRARFQNWFLSNAFEITELVEMRAAVEPYIAELAAQRVTDDELAQLRTSVESFEAILSGDSVDAKVKADEDFHGMLLAASRNRGLRVFYETFIPSLREYRAHVFSPPAEPLLALPHHRAIYEAVLAHDPDQARERMRTHIDHSRLDVQRLAELSRHHTIVASRTGEDTIHNPHTPDVDRGHLGV